MPQTPTAFHALTIPNALAQLDSSEKGLSQDHVLARRAQVGLNELPHKPGPSALSMFLDQFKDFLILILIAAAVISAFLGEFLDAAAIIVIVIINAILGFVQEYRAEKALASLRKMVATTASVWREGELRKIDVKDLVPGDVVSMEAGDKVPADCRLLHTYSFEVEEASLTGESLPVEKDASFVARENAALAEQKNMAFMSTIVTRGKATAVVAYTGTRTQIGRVAQLVSEVDNPETPLQIKLEELGKQLSYVAIAITAFIFIFGIVRGNPVLEMFLLSVSLAVAAIPEGLPAVVTVTLAIGVQRMVKRNAVVRKLPSVEGLGSATVICSDKTGTLTRNEMTVRKVYVNSKDISVSGNGYDVRGSFQISEKPFEMRSDETAQRLLVTASLCNNAALSYENEEPVAKIVGDPTEACLLVLGAKSGINYAQVKSERTFLDEFAFDSERKMMSVIYSEKGTAVSFVKGAPESVITQSRLILSDGKTRPMDAEAKKKLLAQNKTYASEALRVLAFAYKPLPKQSKYTQSDAETELVFLGLVGVIDPPRAEAKDAVALCRQAGIRVVMITGDNPDTARAIATELGIMQKGSQVLTGPQLQDLTDAQLTSEVERVSVYARVSPEHKMRIVTALQKRGEVVAMTGDGVNDAPSIKKADIGISMGITGTEVAKESSDMVILDDNFASIVAAVEEGRVIYDNILKSVKFLVSCNIGEILAIFIAIAASLPSPLAPIQILWMNLTTDSFPAIALGMDAKDPDAMKRPPRSKKEAILNRSNAVQIFLIGLIVAFGTLAFFESEIVSGGSVEHARTAAFCVIVMFQLFLALSFRSETYPIWQLGFFQNRWLWASVIGGILLQIAVVQTGFLEPIFKTEPLSWVEWEAIFLVTLTPLLVLEVSKYVRQKIRR